MAKILKNLLLIVFSLIVALVVAEIGARIIFDPIDFLKPVTIKDEVLRHRIEPGSGAHDDWGFRNTDVPESAQIVTIGDSQTYGISARARDSWPSQLEVKSGNSLYNLSLPGYGPAEYFLLMSDKALGLNPEIIVAGFYLGNDLKDSFTAVYSVPAWTGLRKKGLFSESAQDSLVTEKKDSPSILSFLSSNSVLYRLVSSSVIGDNLRQRRRVARGEEIVMLNNEEHGITTGFTPDRRLKGLDMENPEVSQGLELSLEFFNRMNMLARENGAGFLVVIIPTKESVFSELIEGNNKLLASDKIDSLIANERSVNSVVIQYFDEHGIDYIDVLPALWEGAATEQIYPTNFGGHPNRNGYRIIAETVKSKIKELSLDK